MGITISVIDDILKIIYQSKQLNVETLYRDIRSKQILLHDMEIETILVKLKEDKYLLNFPNGHYGLTVSGRVFIEKGGYKQELNNEKRKALKDQIYIYAVGAGTVLAGLYGLFEMLKWLYHHEGWQLPF